MTEAQWLSCKFSDEMMAFLRGRPGLGRKRRLLAVACCRRVWAWMPEECRLAVEIAERIADGPVSEAERWAAFVAAGEAYEHLGFPESWAGYCAYRAVECPSDYDRPDSWSNDAAWVAQSAAEPASWIDRKYDEAVLAAGRAAIADLIRDIFGNPFRSMAVAPSLLTPGVVVLAQGLYD